MSNDSKISPELRVLLKAAAPHKMTPEERREQKISFVYGQLMDRSPAVTKEQIRKHLEEDK